MAVEVNKDYLLGDFSLEVDRRALVRAGQRQHLASRPFQVLLHLVENRDRFVARTELLDRFWSGKDVYDDTLTKCIGAIRKALDDHRDNPRFIETRYAEGYRYIGPFDLISRRIMVETEQRRDVRIIVEEEEVQLTEADQLQSPLIHAAPPPVRLLSAQTSSRTIALALAVVGIVLAAGAFIVYLTRPRATVNAATSAPKPLRSIAVMPLRNLTGEPANDYFSDGITESLITALSKIQGLKVISRNSVFKFRDKDTDPHEVGERLGVDALLEGSVSRSNGNVRVQSRLVSVSDGSVLWANESYQSDLGDILSTQDEIARGVVAGLRLQLGATDRQQLAKRYTKSDAAYRAYLKGRYLWNQRTAEAMRKAVEQFELATSLDQNFALAYAGLAETYAVMEVNALVPPRTAAPKAKQYAQRALAIDDSLAGAQAALGLIASLSDWNWAEGDRYFQKALTLNPGYATAHSWYANSLLAQGKFEQAESELKRALELDPLSVSISSSLAETYYYGREYERCLVQAAETHELHPAYQLYLGRCHWQQGRYGEAITEFQKSGSSEADLTVARALAAGRTAEARRLIAAGAIGPKGTNNPYYVATQFAAAGDTESAFAWLEKAYVAHQADLVSVKIEPVFDSIRSDPRFADLLRRVGLPQ